MIALNLHLYLPMPVLRECGIIRIIQFHFLAGAILVVRYGTGLIVCAHEIILYMAISLSMKKNIHIKITSSKHFSWYQNA